MDALECPLNGSGARATFPDVPPPAGLDATVWERLTNYRPSGLHEACFADLRPVLLDALAMVVVSMSATSASLTTLAWAISRYLHLTMHIQGNPADLQHLFARERVDRVYDHTISEARRLRDRHEQGQAIKAAGNHRTLIRRVSTAVRGRQDYKPLPVGRRGNLGPYTSAEIAGFLRLARNMPTPVSQAGVRALLALGVGAGCQGSEYSNARAGDVKEDDSGVRLAITGRHPRTIPVAEPWAQMLRNLAKPLRPDQRLVGTDARSHLDDLLARANKRKTDLLPRLTLARLRDTWLIEQMGRHDLSGLLADAGVKKLDTFARLLQHLHADATGSR